MHLHCQLAQSLCLVSKHFVLRKTLHVVYDKHNIADNAMSKSYIRSLHVADVNQLICQVHPMYKDEPKHDDTIVCTTSTIELSYHSTLILVIGTRS